MLTSVTWENAKRPANEAEIANVQADIGFPLPEDYLSIARTYHGASLSGNICYAYHHPGVGSTIYHITHFLSFRPGSDSVPSTLRLLKDQLPNGVIPFGGTAGGDYLCFDYRANQEAPVVALWLHDEGDEALIQLADDFRSFCQILGPDPSL